MCNCKLGDHQNFGPDQIRIYTMRGWVIIDKNELQEELNKMPKETEYTKIHLCDGCNHVFPSCPAKHEDVEYGTANGLDNIIKCKEYSPEL